MPHIRRTLRGACSRCLLVGEHTCNYYLLVQKPFIDNIKESSSGVCNRVHSSLDDVNILAKILIIFVAMLHPCTAENTEIWRPHIFP